MVSIGPWYAVFCAPRCEYMASVMLRRAGFDVFFPHTIEPERIGRTGFKEVSRAYLTGYIFVVLDANHSAMHVNATKGVVEIVRGAADTAMMIPEDVIHRIAKLTDQNGKVCDPRGPYRVHNGFKGSPGDEIKFAESTAFWGLLAQIERVLDDGKRIAVRMQKLFGSERRMIVSTADVGELIPAKAHKSWINPNAPSMRSRKHAGRVKCRAMP